MNYIDIILIAIVVLTAVFAMKKGLLRTIIEFAGFFVTVPLAYIAAKKLAEPVYNSFIRDKLINAVVAQIDKAGDTSGFVSSIQESLGSLGFFTRTFGLDVEGTLNQMAGNVSNISIAQSTVENLIKPIVILMCTSLIFLALFFIVSIFIKLLASLVGKIKLPKVLSGANVALGFVLGAAKGIVTVMLIAGVLGIVQTGFSLKTTAPSKFENAISNSFVVQKVNEINPFLNL